MNSSCSSSSPRLFATKLVTYRAPLLSFSTPKRRRPLRRRASDARDHGADGSLLSISTSSSSGGGADDQSLSLVLDVHRISTLASSRFHWFLDSGRDAFSDLQSLVSLDDNRRLVVSCRKSTMQFVGGFVVVGFVFTFALRALLRLGSALRSSFQGKPKLVVRRDRSLGGREVVVAVETSRAPPRDTRSSTSSSRRNMSPSGFSVRAKQKLPKWWPTSLTSQRSDVDKEDYQREANRLVRAMVDDRISGKDVLEDDIIRLRRLCRIAGIQVSIEPANTRDSFYRTSVDFVVNVCSRASWEATVVDIDGEDAREFIAGLSENIGLEKFDAVRMVSAAVAARTRSWFLQAWALEIQGKHSESLAELSKVCIVHRIFPPDESSAEMEMVARGLEKLMKLEERQTLLKTFVGICCGDDSHRSAAEALGLVH